MSFNLHIQSWIHYLYCKEYHGFFMDYMLNKVLDEKLDYS